MIRSEAAPTQQEDSLNTKPKLVTKVTGKKQSLYMSTQVPPQGTKVKGRTIAPSAKPKSARK